MEITIRLTLQEAMSLLAEIPEQRNFEMMADKLNRYLGMKIKTDSQDLRGQKKLSQLLQEIVL